MSRLLMDAGGLRSPRAAQFSGRAVLGCIGKLETHDAFSIPAGSLAPLTLLQGPVCAPALTPSMMEL